MKLWHREDYLIAENSPIFLTQTYLLELNIIQKIILDARKYDIQQVKLMWNPKLRLVSGIVIEFIHDKPFF